MGAPQFGAELGRDAVGLFALLLSPIQGERVCKPWQRAKQVSFVRQPLLTSGYEGRWHWTFGGRDRDPAVLVDFTPSAALALERFWSLVERWRDSVAAMTDEQLDQPGFGQYPWGLDPGIPFVGIVWWTNRELIHHLAECALLRDLWRARAGQERA